MKKQLRGSLALLGATVIWGSAFIAQSVGMDYIGPFTFQAIRCSLAVLFLIPVTALLELKKVSLQEYCRRWTDRTLWKTGILCGLVLFAAASLQQVGLVSTDAGKAGFITAMYIVLVPVIGMFYGRKPPLTAAISVIVAVIGLYLLSCTNAAGINLGDIYLMGCALAFAVQITLIDRYAAALDGLRLNCIQAGVVAVLSTLCMLRESIVFVNILACWTSLVFAGVLSMGVAYSLQIIGQKDLEPTAASLIMSLESVFAALGGWLLLHERMSSWELLGCLLVFSAVIFSQLPSRK